MKSKAYMATAAAEDGSDEGSGLVVEESGRVGFGDGVIRGNVLLLG